MPGKSGVLVLHYTAECCRELEGKEGGEVFTIIYLLSAANLNFSPAVSLIVLLLAPIMMVMGPGETICPLQRYVIGTRHYTIHSSLSYMGLCEN